MSMLRPHEKWGVEERAHQTPPLLEVAKNLRQLFVNQVIGQDVARQRVVMVSAAN